MSETLTSSALADSIDLVLFSAGTWRVGMEARWIRSSHGAAHQAGGTSIETLLGMDIPMGAAATTRCQSLQLKLPGGDMDVLVGGPVELLSMPATAIHALPPLVAARIGLRALRALALAPQVFAQGAILLLDALVLDKPARG